MKMTKIQLRIFFVACLLILTLFVLLSVNKQYNKSEKNIETFSSNGTWGYNILIKDKIVIHQEIIPAIEGNQKFESEKDAIKVAKLVISKIKAGKMPTISRFEIDSLKIAYNTL